MGLMKYCGLKTCLCFFPLPNPHKNMRDEKYINPSEQEEQKKRLQIGISIKLLDDKNQINDIKEIIRSINNNINQNQVKKCFNRTQEIIVNKRNNDFKRED